MPAYYFFDAQEIADPAAMERYRKAVFQTVRKFGGKYLTVGGDLTVVEGSWRPTIPVLIEFPTIQQARDWYDSSEYAPLKALRLGTTRGHAILLNAAPWDGTLP